MQHKYTQWCRCSSPVTRIHAYLRDGASRRSRLDHSLTSKAAARVVRDHERPYGIACDDSELRRISLRNNMHVKCNVPAIPHARSHPQPASCKMAVATLAQHACASHTAWTIHMDADQRASAVIGTAGRPEQNCTENKAVVAERSEGDCHQVKVIAITALRCAAMRIGIGTRAVMRVGLPQCSDHV